ncbi:MAG TPA: tetratricopeptide repeat protein [Candidatus Deferrimicrobium sp.]|nr:tetratricopeptide repeat protein [Candidatus Deferrimicrobium sp.]
MNRSLSSIEDALSSDRPALNVFLLIARLVAKYTVIGLLGGIAGALLFWLARHLTVLAILVLGLALAASGLLYDLLLDKLKLESIFKCLRLITPKSLQMRVALFAMLICLIMYVYVRTSFLVEKEVVLAADYNGVSLKLNNVLYMTQGTSDGISQSGLDSSNVLFKLREYERAEQWIRRELQKDSLKLDRAYELGINLVMQGKLQEAVQILKDEAEQAPSNAMVVNALGVVLASLGDNLNAEKCFRTVVDLTPEDSHPLWNLAVILVRQGNVDDGYFYFEEAMRLGPDPIARLSTIGHLVSINDSTHVAVVAYSHSE